jgi:hypothetical protein
MRLKERYKINKEAKRGEVCTCPSCGAEFVKTRADQAFCTTKKKLHGTKDTRCKDFYWNSVTPTKRNNTTRISPANARYYNEVIEPRKEWSSLDDGLDYLLDCGDR